MSLCSHFANYFKLAYFSMFDGTHLAHTLDIRMTSYYIWQLPLQAHLTTLRKNILIFYKVANTHTVKCPPLTPEKSRLL